LYGHPVDVKGTTNRCPNPVAGFTPSLMWHYVFIQVAKDNDHAIFQGYAFGGDNWQPYETGYLPPKLGSWHEFKEIVRDWSANHQGFLDSL
jgi:hypothetical protein